MRTGIAHDRRLRPQRMERLWSLAGATSGNRWQITLRRRGLKQAKTVAVGCDRLPRKRHGKEGVDGSSPPEGLQKNPCKWAYIVLPATTKTSVVTGTRRAHFGTGGHSRAGATSRDTAWNVPKTLDRDHSLERLLQTGGWRCRRRCDADSSFAREGVSDAATPMASTSKRRAGSRSNSAPKGCPRPGPR
jgi:hypothetical protein